MSRRYKSFQKLGLLIAVFDFPVKRTVTYTYERSKIYKISP